MRASCPDHNISTSIEKTIGFVSKRKVCTMKQQEGFQYENIDFVWFCEQNNNGPLGAVDVFAMRQLCASYEPTMRQLQNDCRGGPKGPRQGPICSSRQKVLWHYHN